MFGMGTGVASLPSSLDSFFQSDLFTQNWIGDIETGETVGFRKQSWLSPRSISIRQLHVSPRFHLEPIYLIVFEGSYLLAQWETGETGGFRKQSWLSPRSISIRQLHVSPRFHLEPIYLIVFEGSYLLAQWEISS